MNKFSEKTLQALGEYYVYALIDPRVNQIFYIGKGSHNRVFEHEEEDINDPYSNKDKLNKIKAIKKAGYDIGKIIINDNLTEDEAYAAEASLINAFNYIGKEKLTNIVSGHHTTEALTVEEYERINGATELKDIDIKHNILVIRINKLYRSNMSAIELYNAVRGIWKLSYKKVKEIQYVFGVYNSLIVGVYKPTKWFICKEAKEYLPRKDIILTKENEDRLFFRDEYFEKGITDSQQNNYLGKSINGLNIKQGAQNPVTYLYPQKP